MERKNNNAVFILGLIIGVTIAIFILISDADKQKIVKKAKDKLKNFFKDGVEPKITSKKKKTNKTSKVIAKKVVEPVKKISVTVPEDIETINLTPVKTAKPKKVFKKSK